MDTNEHGFKAGVFHPCLSVLIRGSLLFLVSLATSALAAEAPSRPNILFILTDDQRFDAIGANGNPHIHTPHLDELAARSVRFTNAHVVMSLCSPSRAAILTGRYGSANGVTRLDAPLRAGETTFAQHLKAAGYRTAFRANGTLAASRRQSGSTSRISSAATAPTFAGRCGTMAPSCATESAVPLAACASCASLECGGSTPLWTGRLDGPPRWASQASPTESGVKPPHSKFHRQLRISLSTTQKSHPLAEVAFGFEG